jgi:hypothetical protein
MLPFSFPGQELLDSGERVDAEARDVIAAGIAAVTVDRVDLHPQAVVPVRAAQLREPCAHGDHEQDEKQYRNAYGLQHWLRRGCAGNTTAIRP